MSTPTPQHSPEISEAVAIAALLRRVAGATGVHMYEMEFLGETEYVCHVWIGQALESLLGGVPEGMDEEAAWEACVHVDDRARYRETFAALQRGEPSEIEYRLVGFDGVERWVWERCRPRRTADGRLLIDGIVSDITEHHLAQQELAGARDRLAHMAYHDPLTDLPNRLLFHEHLEVALERARRDGTAVAVLFIDLDGFKTVNDRHGHVAGDAALRSIADRLRSVSRASDVVARLGGDEFLMLAALADERAAPAAAAQALADRVRAVLGPPLQTEGHELVLTASVGLSLFPSDAETADDLLRASDAAMYGQKPPRGRPDDQAAA